MHEAEPNRLRHIAGQAPVWFFCGYSGKLHPIFHGDVPLARRRWRKAKTDKSCSPISMAWPY